MRELPVDYTTLTRQERASVREQYVVIQEGYCFYCGGELELDPPRVITNHRRINWSLFPDGFLNHPIHLQHDHDTAMTEGAVHAYCNAVMWQYEGR